MADEMQTPQADPSTGMGEGTDTGSDTGMGGEGQTAEPTEEQPAA